MRIRFMAILALLAAASGAQMAAAEDGGGDADRAEQYFKRFDRDGDGQITRDEAEEGKRGLFERLLREADKDKNEKLSKDEFMAGMKALGPDRPGERAGERVAERVAERAAERGERKREATGGPEGPEGMFKRLDANRDGKIEKSEVPEQLQPLFGKLLEHADSDKDGTISTAEFEAVKPRLAERLGHGDFRPNPDNLFKHLDANRDGKVEKSEVPEERRDGFAKLLERGDKNGDGALSEEEFKAALPQGDRPEGRAEGRGRESKGSETRGPEGRGSEARGPEGRGPFGGFAILRALDINGDGELSKDEIAQASSSLSKLDRNGDGKITRDEVGSGGRLSEGGERPRFQLIERVIKMDKNGDGQIAKEEARERLRDQFQQIDRNGDGKLDKAELQDYLGEVLRRGGIQRGEERKPEERKSDDAKPAERKAEERKSE